MELTSQDQLLHAAEQLPADDLKHFLQRVIYLEATRRDPPLSANETELLQAINREPPAERVSRYVELKAKRDTVALTDQETNELLDLSDWLEEVHAERLGHVAELAKRRGVSLVAMLGQLGLKRWGE